MRKVTSALVAALAVAGFTAAPAQAHQGHASCQAAGLLAAALAQEPGPLGAEVSAVARERGVDEFVAFVHLVFCEPRP